MWWYKDSASVKLDLKIIDKNTFFITFDLNASVNMYIKKTKNKVFNKYKHLLYNIQKCEECLKCEKYAFYYLFYFKNNKKRDVSNYIKFFEDLVFYVLNDDDSKVDMLFVQKNYYENKDYNYLLVFYECV